MKRDTLLSAIWIAVLWILWFGGRICHGTMGSGQRALREGG